MNELTTILADRKKTHGDWVEHATCTQEIKAVMSRYRNHDKLVPSEIEALEMIAHKIGRILTGDPHFEDHWRDIAGYATLAADRNKVDDGWKEAS